MPADVAMTTTGGEGVTRAIERAGAIVGIESSEAGAVPFDVDVGFVDYPFTKPGNVWATHKAVVRRREPMYAVAPDVEDRADLDRAIEQADELAEYADVVILTPKAVAPSEIPDRFRVGLPFQPSFGSGGIELPAFEGAARQSTLLDFGSNRIEDFQGVGPVHVLGGAPHDQLRIPHFGVDVGSVDTSVPLQYARFGRVWFRPGQVEFPEHDLYDRLEASLRNIRRAWGADVAPTIELTDQMREILEADGREERERLMRFMQSGARGAPPLADPDRAQVPSVERFFGHKYQLPDPL